MKITAFNPLIVSNDADSVIALLEELGFERKHTKEGINDHVTSVDLVNDEGFRVDVASSDHVPQDLTAIRMNVRDFDETYQMLVDRGFVNMQGDAVSDTGSSKATLMRSPSGFMINLVEHIK